MDRRNLLLNMYQSLSSALGPSGWWPGQTPFEVAVGAILTQNTAWKNVEKAIANLRNEDCLSAERIFSMSEERLAELIRPAGYFRLKTARLKSFMRFLREECGFNLKSLAVQGVDKLRPKLLSVKGIGPETADCILLYALNLPSFVVDAYTIRIMNRHLLVHEDIEYEELRSFFADSLPGDVDLFNEYHALLVRCGHAFCGKKTPKCGDCPLKTYLN